MWKCDHQCEIHVRMSLGKRHEIISHLTSPMFCEILLLTSLLLTNVKLADTTNLVISGGRILLN